jgi:hypothetical protein
MFEVAFQSMGDIPHDDSENSDTGPPTPPDKGKGATLKKEARSRESSAETDEFEKVSDDSSDAEAEPAPKNARKGTTPLGLRKVVAARIAIARNDPTNTASPETPHASR